MPNCNIPTVLFGPQHIGSTSRDDCLDFLRDAIVVLHSHRADATAVSVAEYALDCGVRQEQLICIDTCDDNGAHLRALRSHLGIVGVDQQTILEQLDRRGRPNDLGIRSFSSLQGKGVTDWCAILSLELLEMPGKWIVFCDTDLENIREYDPLFLLGAGHVLAGELSPCRVLPAYCGRNNERLVTALHVAMGVSELRRRLGKPDNRLDHALAAHCAQVWSLAGEYSVPRRIFGKSWLAEMLYPSDYGIEFFIGAALGELLGAIPISEREAHPIVQVSQNVPRSDRKNSLVKEQMIFNQISLWLGIYCESRISISSPDNLRGIASLNETAHGKVLEMHALHEMEPSKVYWNGEQGLLLPPPSFVIRNGWLNGRDVRAARLPR